MFSAGLLLNSAYSEAMKLKMDLDSKVKGFLERPKGQWVDWNVPGVEG
jgi:hypothetical protein